MMRTLLLLTLLSSTGLWASSASAQAPRPKLGARYISLRLNGAAVRADTVDSRIEVSTGAGKVLTLNIVRADAPDDPGLTILVDEFKPAPTVYRFKDILSAHVREATYRLGDLAVESMACSVNDGEVRITAIDQKLRVLTGTFRAVLCRTSGQTGEKRIVVEGAFRYPYDVR